jgi:hypothetical protein
MSPISLRGAETPVREKPATKVARVSASAIWPAVVRAGKVLVATLREIFDESAYQRFLNRKQLESSPNAYAVFRKENEQSKSRKPRCC